MKFLPLIWSTLWRSRMRTLLTFLSIAVAFVLFALLRTLESGFLQGVRVAGDDRLIVTFKAGLTNVLPYAYRSQIERVAGVVGVTPVFPFGATWQDPKQQIPGGAVDPFVEVDTSMRMLPEQFAAWRAVRTGLVIGDEVAARTGWKIGDHVALTLPVHRKDGSRTWEFDVVGVFDFDRSKLGADRPANMILARYDYWNESVQYPDLVPWFLVRIADPGQAEAVGRAIDTQFRNAPKETRTRPEKEFARSFVRQLGDVGAIVAAILAAVFFTLALVAGNTMMQAFRERIPEFGVLKTIGFTGGRIAALVAAESVVLCLAAGLGGLAVASQAVRILDGVQFQGGGMPGLEPGTVVEGAGVALVLGLAAALVPAWRAARLSVVDALAVE